MKGGKTMNQADELIARFLKLFGNDEKAQEIAASGDLLLMWKYIYIRHDKGLSSFDKRNLVEACENLDFEQLGKIYKKANLDLNYLKTFDVNEEMKSYKMAFPDDNEEQLAHDIEWEKELNAEEQAFLKSLIEAFKSLNLQEIYARAKRECEISDLIGDLAPILFNPTHKVIR